MVQQRKRWISRHMKQEWAICEPCCHSIKVVLTKILIEGTESKCTMYARYNLIKEVYLRTSYTHRWLYFHQNKPSFLRMAAWLKWELILLLNPWVAVSVSVPAYEAHPCALYQTSSIAAIPALNQFKCMWEGMLIATLSKSSHQCRSMVYCSFWISALH